MYVVVLWDYQVIGTFDSMEEADEWLDTKNYVGKTVWLDTP